MNTKLEAIMNSITHLPPGTKLLIVTDARPKESAFEPAFPPPPKTWDRDLTGLLLQGGDWMGAEMEWCAEVIRRTGEFTFKVRVTMDRWQAVDRVETFDVRAPQRGWWGYSAAPPRRRWKPANKAIFTQSRTILATSM